jgi:hypothetical protein
VSAPDERNAAAYASWSDDDWDNTWDAAEPPPRSRKPRGLLSRLAFLVLAIGLLAGGSLTGLAFYSVDQTIDAFSGTSDEDLTRFVSAGEVSAQLEHDLTAQPAPASVGAAGARYLASIQENLSSAWQSPAAIRDMVKRRVLAPGLGGSEDTLADHFSRIEVISPTRLAIDLTDSETNSVVIGLCLGFVTAPLPLWQVDHLAWQTPQPHC